MPRIDVVWLTRNRYFNKILTWKTSHINWHIESHFLSTDKLVIEKKISKTHILLIRKRMKELYIDYGTTYMYKPVKLCWSLNIKTIMKFHRTQHKRRQKKRNTISELKKKSAQPVWGLLEITYSTDKYHALRKEI